MGGRASEGSSDGPTNWKLRLPGRKCGPSGDTRIWNNSALPGRARLSCSSVSRGDAAVPPRSATHSARSASPTRSELARPRTAGGGPARAARLPGPGWGRPFPPSPAPPGSAKQGTPLPALPRTPSVPAPLSPPCSALWPDVTGASANELKRNGLRRESGRRSSQWPRGEGGPRRECESERPRAWGAAGGAGGARRRRGARRGAGARRGRPLPLPSAGRAPRAAGVSAPGREMRPPLGLLAGNARGGPCRAERPSVLRGELSWARSGRGVLAVAEPRAPRAGPGPEVVPLGVGSRTCAAAGVTGDASPERPGVSCTRDNGRGVEGARPACPLPGSCALPAPGRGHRRHPCLLPLHGRSVAPGAYQAPAVRPRNGHLAAEPRAWPPGGRGAGDGWAQPGLLAACPRLKAAPLQRRERPLLRAGCRAERRENRVPPARAPGASELPLPRAGLEFREAEQVAQPPPYLLRTPRGFWSC